MINDPPAFCQVFKILRAPITRPVFFSPDKTCGLMDWNARCQDKKPQDLKR
jgi:hypothetical protein